MRIQGTGSVLSEFMLTNDRLMGFRDTGEEQASKLSIRLAGNDWKLELRRTGSMLGVHPDKGCIGVVYIEETKERFREGDCSFVLFGLTGVSAHGCISKGAYS